MFKIITDFIPKPSFMILCDRSCGTFATVDLPDDHKPEFADALQAMWAGDLQKQGWRITLAEQVCPAHVKQDAAGKSMIVIPHMSAAAQSN